MMKRGDCRGGCRTQRIKTGFGWSSRSGSKFLMEEGVTLPFFCVIWK